MTGPRTRTGTRMDTLDKGLTQETQNDQRNIRTYLPRRATNVVDKQNFTKYQHETMHDGFFNVQEIIISY